jgi:hypothetical protein
LVSARQPQWIDDVATVRILIAHCETIARSESIDWPAPQENASSGFHPRSRWKIAFFELHPSNFGETAYQVRSAVSVELFSDFLNYLKSKQLPKNTTANAKALYLLSEELGVFDLSSLCGELVSNVQTVDSPLISAGSGVNANYLSQTTEFESFRLSFPFCLSDSLFSFLNPLLASRADRA